MESSNSFTSADLFRFLSRFEQVITGQFDRLNRILESSLQQHEAQRELLNHVIRNQQQQQHKKQQQKQPEEILDEQQNVVARELQYDAIAASPQEHPQIEDEGRVSSIQDDSEPPTLDCFEDQIDAILQAYEDPVTTAKRRHEVEQHDFSINLDNYDQVIEDVPAPVESQNAADSEPSLTGPDEVFIQEDFEPPTFDDLMDVYSESFQDSITTKAVKRLAEATLSDFFNEDGELLDSIPQPPRKKRRKGKSKKYLGTSMLRPQQQGSGDRRADGDVQRELQQQTPSTSRDEEPRPIFRISHVRHLPPRHNKRFNTKEVDVVMTVQHNLRDFAGNIMQVGDELDEFYENLMQKYLDELQSPEDYYSFMCVFKNAYPIQLFGKKKMFDRTQFTNALYNMAQSNTALQLGGGVGIRIGLIPAGHTGTSNTLRQRGLSSDKRARHSRNIITIKNKDNLCGWRALAVGLWRAENPKDSELPKLPPENPENGQRCINNRLGDDFLARWRRTRDPQYRYQKEAAEALMVELGVEPGVPMTSEHYPIIAQYLEARDIQFIVMSTVAPSPLYKNDYNEKFMGLLFTPGETQYNPGHYDVFLDLKGVYCTGLACRKCWKVTNGNLWANHRCFVCDTCLTKHAEDDGSGVPVKCIECCRTFKNQVCYDNHRYGTEWTKKRKRTTTCKMIKYCESCEIEYQTREGVHECGLFKCHVCSEKYTETPHYCHIKPLDKETLQKEDDKLKIIVCFDIESVIDSENGYKHKPVLLKAQTTCQACWDNATNAYKINTNDGSDVDCPNCQTHYLSFDGPDCVASFVNYIFDVLAPIKPRPNQKKLKCHEIYVFAHNSRAYDGIFVISEILKMNKLKPYVIANGLKIVKLKVSTVRFLDTLYLFPMSLAALPGAFGIEDKSKGRFPYNLLTMDNYDSEEPHPFPPLSAFEPDRLKEKDRKGLIEWYNARAALNEPYVFKHELHTYCANDVEILLKVLMKFRQLFKSITGLDPITRKFTLASIAMESFRANNLGEHKMGVTPISSYNSRGASITGHIWLDWIEKTRQISLCREYCVYGVYYADAVHVESKTVFEFLGCFWHGCRRCFEDQEATNPKHGVPYRVLNAAVAEKRRYYTKHGFNCEFVWECDFKHMKRQDPELEQFYRERKEYYKSTDIVGPIQLRDALKGGRTNNIKFLHETTDEESIRYLDVCSLYPAQLKRQKYPLSHPTKITKDFDMSLESYFGYVQCAVDPPPRLRFGVLPLTINGKLTFPLFLVCVETQTTSFCRHTPEQRRYVDECGAPTRPSLWLSH